MTAHSYTVWVYKSSATDLSSGDVAYTFDSQLQAPPQPVTPVIRPLEGRAETRSWPISIVDSGSTVTGILADTTGRFHLLNRIIAVKRSVDGAGSTWLGVGRIADVSLNPDVASYTITVEDEHRIARVTDLFSSNTTLLYPGGSWVNYGPWPRPDLAKISYVTDTLAGPRRLVVLLKKAQAAHASIAEAASEDRLDPSRILYNNAASTQGNYRNLKLRVWSTGVTNPYGSTNYTDLPVYGFPTNKTGGLVKGSELEGGITAYIDDSIDGRNNSRMSGLLVMVSDTGTIINTPSPAIVPQQWCALHKMGAAPSQATPLHYGGAMGKHPADVIADMYSATYAASTAPTVPRFSTAAMDTLKADTRYPKLRFRITEGKQPMARFLEENVYITNQIVAVTDAQGRIAPTGLLLPQSSSAVTVSLTGANLRAPHPTFGNSAAEQVTVARYRYSREIDGKDQLNKRPLRGYYGQIGGQHGYYASPQQNQDMPPGGDLLGSLSETHDVESRTTVHGRHIMEIAAPGWHTEYLGPNPTLWQGVVQAVSGNRAVPNANAMGTHILQRYADGPVTGMLSALSTAEAVQPGDYVKLELETYPNARTLARGSTRIIQIMSKQITPMGPVYEYLDAGRDAQPLTAPTAVALTAGPAGSTKLALQVAVGGVLGKAVIQMAPGSTLPPATSTKWADVMTATSTVAQTVAGLASNTTWHARAWNVKPYKFQSAYSYSTARPTASLTAPSGFTVSSAGTYHAKLTWTNGESGYRTAFLGAASTSVTLTTAYQVANLAAGTRRYTWTGLSSNSTYLAGVRHIDPYGGYSAVASTTLETANTTAGIQTASTIGGMSILFGAST